MNQDYQDNHRPLDISSNGTLKPYNPAEFAFKSFLSLEPLIKAWKQHETSDEPIKAAFAKRIREELQNAPELLGRIDDLSVIEKHAGLVTQLLSLVFPPAYWEDMIAAAVIPFQAQPFFASPKFQRLNLVRNGRYARSMNIDEEHAFWGRTLNAYSRILRQYYGVETNFEYPLVFTFLDPQTGLDRHFKILVDTQFIEVKKIADPKPLGPEDIKRLLANPTNLKLWHELIPPQCFEFYGFVIFNAIDVTDQEVLSALKNDLLEKDAIISMARFRSLEEKLRALLRQPNLKLGLAGLPGASNLLREHGRIIGRSFILNEACRNKCGTFAGSIYDRAIKQGQTVIVEDLASRPSLTPVEEAILQQGVKNILVAPLRFENQLIGLLEIGSPTPGDINAINALKLKGVLALFSIAIKRSMDELNDRLEAVIKEKCTAIHPSVEWRFRHAALKYLQDRNEGIISAMEPIAFDEVHPLYGLSDIRGSSTIRNDAIRDDLTEQLNMAREIILLAHRHKTMPYLAQLNHRIGQQLKRIENGIGSGDEVNILEFLRWEVEPHFDHLQEFDSLVGEKIQSYRAALDPAHGILFRKRKDYEDSVAMINETISGYIDAEQAKAQAIFPHYFEKFKSDGVEHCIYIGASLVENGKFDLLYLKNIRLWQLMMLCGVARQAEMVKPKLKVPLETAHLLLVQNTPLAIRFRYDEKKFDVDGAYNVRYEIMKKRIDKAVIKGTEERLTQPGKIAIVYSHAKEATEYLEYIDYLQASGYLTDELEDFELEDLQGMHGLKALRVTVNLQASVIKPPAKKKEIQQTTQEMALEAV
jgi:hypothetical protein